MAFVVCTKLSDDRTQTFAIFRASRVAGMHQRRLSSVAGRRTNRGADHRHDLIDLACADLAPDQIDPFRQPGRRKVVFVDLREVSF